MELPTCPACKQSVLDEDAVECPFCGAPMKGGAGAARPGPKPAAAKSSRANPEMAKPGSSRPGSAPDIAARPAAGRGKPAAAEAEPAAPADDDPFAVDPSIAAGAIPVSRQPGPNKPLEVVCPMCETKGFVSLKAAGKQVKCCNPQCMVPIFTAPAPEKKEVVAPPPKPKMQIPPLYIGAAVVVLALGGYFVYLKMQPEPIKEMPPIITGEYKSNPGPGDQAADHKNTGQPDGTDTKDQGPLDPQKARQQIVKQALVRMLEVSPKIESQRKHAWRRLAIKAYLYADENKDAQDQLDLIKRPNGPVYEGVLPVAVLAWRNAARPNDFSKTVEDARQLSEKLPPRGRYATEAAIATAALLVAAAKSDDARQLLEKHHSEPLIEQLAAALRVVNEDETFNLDTTLIGRTIGDWQRPMETAVTLILGAHGRWDDALAWSTQAEDPITQTEGVIAWAESYARQAVPADDASGWERATKAGQNLPVDGKIRLLARLAAVKVSKDDRPGAEAMLAQAAQAFKTLPEAKPISISTIKEVYDLKLTAAETAAARQSALAATEVAGVQAQLGHADAAWGSVRLALSYLRSIGPAYSAMEERRVQLEKNQNGVENELSRELGVKKADDKRSALKRYKERFRDAHAAAVNRFQSLEIVLKAAVNFGLLDQVWDELQAIERKRPKDQDSLLSTALPLLLSAHYEEAGNQQKRDEILGIVQSRVDPANPDVVEQNADQQFKAGDLNGCVQQLNAAMNPHGTLHEFALRLACRLVNQGKVVEAISFCSRIKDQSTREDGLFLTSALAARSGKGEDYWKSATGLGPMETSCICSGLVVGLNSHQPGK